MCSVFSVTPRVGVWIETYNQKSHLFYKQNVTPRVGVWIETLSNKISLLYNQCHSPRGSVD